MRRVLVCGGRKFRNRELMFRVLDASDKAQAIGVIISGMAYGADTLAVEWAKKWGVTVEGYPADWDRYGRSAGPRRNQQMLDEGKPDVVYAFPGGVGTADMVKRAHKAGVTVVKIRDVKR